MSIAPIDKDEYEVRINDIVNHVNSTNEYLNLCTDSIPQKVLQLDSLREDLIVSSGGFLADGVSPVGFYHTRWVDNLNYPLTLDSLHNSGIKYLGEFNLFLVQEKQHLLIESLRED